MLTDIFANRYFDTPIWGEFGERERRLLVQAFRIVSEQLFPYYDAGGKERQFAKETWDSLNKQLAMELGLKDLSSPTYGYYSTAPNGTKHWVSGFYAKISICETFVCAEYDGSMHADRFIKERLSFIEIAFRRYQEDIDKKRVETEKIINDAITKVTKAPQPITFSKPTRSYSPRGSSWTERLDKQVKAEIESYDNACAELNTRFRQAGTNLDYHNGYIQIVADTTTATEIDEPFWRLVADVGWANVDHDMKEAIDLRDSNGRDPSFYAARALESTVKIISDKKGWTHGGEKGAANYIDNLRAKKNGQFINEWEADGLRKFFTEVRNPFGHGPGSGEMPNLSAQQTDWAIEFCMSWIKNLIRRL